ILDELCPGAYTVTVTDASACSSTTTGVINNIPGPNVTIAVTNSITGNFNGSVTANATGGQTCSGAGTENGYHYSWSSYGNSGQTLNGLNCGNTEYTV